MASKKLKEVIDFLQNPCDNGWDKDELLTDYVVEIIKTTGSDLVFPDELSVNNTEKEIMVLSDFANQLFDKIIEGVCNIIETA